MSKLHELNAKLDSLVYFQDGGVDPQIIQQVVNDAQVLGHEGQTRVAISQQLFQKLSVALQEFYMLKNQVDASTVQNAVKEAKR